MRSTIIFLLCFGFVYPQQTLYELMQSEPDLSEFFGLVSRNELLTTLLKFRQGTVFAPTNGAMRAYNGLKDANFMLYHLANVAVTSDKLDVSISSELPGNPPLWITRRDVNAYEPDIYVNNAKIVRKDIRAASTTQEEQVLHIIDQVLEPILATSRDPSLSNPDAARLMERASAFGLETLQVTDFLQQVSFNSKMRNFASPGRYTFFIPINRGFETVSREKIDAKVIDGHVIPNVALFTRPSISGRPYQTLAFTDNLKVTVSVSNESSPSTEGGYRIYAQSNTLVGDYNHPRGVVLAQVVKANIPVRNGVVHLIDKPLIVIDTDIVNFLKEERNGRLYEFYRVLKDYAQDFMDDITRAGELTLFAPSNEAFLRLGENQLNALYSNKERLREILQLHAVRRRLPSEEIFRSHMHQVETIDHNRKLYFNVVGSEENSTITVEGGGVNATIIQPDIGALNGIVHIIDRVLGIASATVYEKLRTDPMITDSFQLGEQDEFNHRTNDTNQRFTYFVPANEAWDRVYRTMGSSYKKLFMGSYSYQVQQILERHLLVGKAYRVSELAQMTRTAKDNTLQTIRGQVKLTVLESSGAYETDEPQKEYYLEWEGLKARIIRPDVQCTNGVIHVIDTVLVKARDITVNGQPAVVPSVLATFFLAVWAVAGRILH